MVEHPDVPSWMDELVRLAGSRSQVFVHGNVKDAVPVPVRLPEGDTVWTLRNLRQAIFDLFTTHVEGYEVVAAYDAVDGMVFADDDEPSSKMAGVFDSIQPAGQKSGRSKNVPAPSKPTDTLGLVMHQMRGCLANTQHPCVFVLDYASHLAGPPNALMAEERVAFLRMLKASHEATEVRVTGKDGSPVMLRNLLVVVCDRMTDLPAWLYFNNPYSGSIELTSPATEDRQQFFERFLTPSYVVGRDPHEMADLTDGMTVRDLMGVRALAMEPDAEALSARQLIDRFRYGARKNLWSTLPWDTLDNAEADLAHRVKGQPAAIAQVADVLRRARLHLSGAQHSGRGKPRGVLFFAGPTGVGKTELAKAMAELIFSTDEACVRFDMSEYSQQHADQRLLGAPPGYVGYEEGGQLTNRMKANPFSVLLFDEIEKAHPTILDKFLQILEDGRMTDGRGETVYFSESLIVFTSNVGIYELDPYTLRPAVGDNGKPRLAVDPAVDTTYDAVREKVLDGVRTFFKVHLGRPELLNRIGQNIVVFDFVRPEVMREILDTKVIDSIRSIVAERWGLQVEFAPDVLDTLFEIGGSDTANGGRGIGNLAETALLNPLARRLYEMVSEHKFEDDAAVKAWFEGKTLHVSQILLPEGEAGRYDVVCSAL